ncbi:hypothetical protein LCGC14_0730790 [marine sediment metagenome]|uniref:Uncharacterized protein n=1 Tax=marine sediment metagenome TaxID=412755 RepID=A0A0F9Q9Q0_9ZZZZ
MAGSPNYQFLSEVIDDLDHEQLTELMNWLAIKGYAPTRPNINAWRRERGLASSREDIASGRD